MARRGHPTDLTDAQWAVIKSHLPSRVRARRALLPATSPSSEKGSVALTASLAYQIAEVPQSALEAMLHPEPPAIQLPLPLAPEPEARTTVQA